MPKRSKPVLLLAFAAAARLHAGALPPSPVTVKLHGARFAVELATDPVSREHGLMMRTRLAPDHGMLFVLPDSGPLAFWMKDTLLPLDILFFDDDRKLVSMQLDVPPCKTTPCPAYPSDKPARYVLEVSAGTARRIDARIGDTLSIDGAIGPVR